MNTQINAIIVKVQKALYAANGESTYDAAVIRTITRNLSALSFGELRAVLMTMTVNQIIAKYGN